MKRCRKKYVYAVVMNWGSGLWPNPVKLTLKKDPGWEYYYYNRAQKVDWWPTGEKRIVTRDGYNMFIFDKHRDAKLFANGAKAFKDFMKQFFVEQ